MTITAIQSTANTSRCRQHLAECLREAIENGEYGPGQTLPTEAELVKEHGLSRHNVRMAMLELVNLGLIARTPGQGTVVVRRQMQIRRVSFVVQEPREWLAGGVAHGLMDAFQESNIRMELVSSGDEQPEFDKAIGDIIDSGSDGVVVSPLPWLKNHEWAFKLKQAKIPFALVNEPIEGVDANVACMDNFLGGKMAAEHLIERGYRRLFVVSPESASVTIRQRRDGFMAGVSESDKVESCLPLFFPLGLEDKRDHANPWKTSQRAWKSYLERINLKEQIGVFAISDLEAYGVCQACKELGLCVGRDVGIVGFDDRELSRVSEPPITTVRNMPEEMGRRAGELLLNQLDNGEKDSRIEVITPEIITRDSTASGR